MKGSKKNWKRSRYESRYGKYLCCFDLGDFNRKIRRMPCSVDTPDGGYFKRVDTFFAWGD